MKKILLLAIVLLSLFFIQGNRDQTYAQRYTSCDQCGLCITPSDIVVKNSPLGELGDIPGHWERCRNCLYPDVTTAVASDRATLLIPDTLDPDGLPINIPPTVHPGHYYTAVGCLSTDLASFSEEGAAAGVVTPILNILFSLTGGIAFLYLMYGAFLILTSRGDVEQLSQGKRTVMGSIIGLVFVLTSVFLINLIANGVLKIPGFG